MKKSIILIFLFLVFALLVYPTSVFEYNETDFISLRPTASDYDNDSLTYFFSSPLSNKGEWQTTYGDAGIYNTKVTVSDGRLLTTQNITLIINKKEEPPSIKILSPEDKELYITEGEQIFFSITASDINKDDLSILWIVDDMNISEKNFFTYTSDFYSQGEHSVEVIVSDGNKQVSESWHIEIEDFDRSELLDGIKSITVNETDKVVLNIPDFSKYSLHYNISEPIGIDGIWKTTYNDSGLYEIIISIWDDKNFSDEKMIKLLVENVDRPPLKLEKSSFWISEDEEFSLLLNYTDPDGDKVTVTAENLPESAVFKNNIITWKPDFDTVTKDTILDSIARNYHIMNRLFKIAVNASSNGITTTQYIGVRVFDTNRPPTIQAVPEVTINEGEIVSFDISSSDPDNDSLSFSFDNSMINKNNYQTKFGSSGTYVVGITTSDGFLKDKTYTKVNVLPVNEPPTLKNIASNSIREGETLKIELKASDPEDDTLSYSVEPMPDNSYFRDNTLIWQPDFDTVKGQDNGVFDLQFSVTDGEHITKTPAQVTVSNVNRPPILTTFSQIDGYDFDVGEEIDFYVNIFDPDNDPISYKWKTGFFTEVEANNTIAVKYDSKGRKTVKVTATDGEFSVEKKWTINIVKKPKIKIIPIEH